MLVVAFSSKCAVDYDGNPLYVGHSLRTETIDAVADDEAVFCDLFDSWDGYWRLLEKLWGAGQDFIICEQDMVPHPGAASELLACPRPWCAFPYDHFGRTCIMALGFTKFSGALTTREADIFTRATEIEPSRHWASLDRALCLALGERGYGAHIHQPMITHLIDGRPQ